MTVAEKAREEKEQAEREAEREAAEGDISINCHNSNKQYFFKIINIAKK